METTKEELANLNGHKNYVQFLNKAATIKWI